MNTQARRAIRAASPLAAAMLLASCVSPELTPELYAPPLEAQPAAWIKLQYVYYTGVRGGPATLRVRMSIREGQEEKFRPAHNQNLGPLSKVGSPKVPMHAMRIRPAQDTAVRMGLGFEWSSLELLPPPIGGTDLEGKLRPPTDTYPPVYEDYEVGCSATQQFNPEPGKVYLISYTTLPRRCGPECWLPEYACQVAIFLETATGKGTFKLESVGEPYVE